MNTEERNQVRELAASDQMKAGLSAVNFIYDEMQFMDKVELVKRAQVLIATTTKALNEKPDVDQDRLIRTSAVIIGTLSITDPKQADALTSQLIATYKLDPNFKSFIAKELKLAKAAVDADQEAKNVWERAQKTTQMTPQSMPVAVMSLGLSRVFSNLVDAPPSSWPV